MHLRMHPNDRNSSHGATIIPLARPIVGQAAGIPAKPPRLLDQFRERLRGRCLKRTLAGSF
jgi:hypothetical protein